MIIISALSMTTVKRVSVNLASNPRLAWTTTPAQTTSACLPEDVIILSITQFAMTAMNAQ
jgi:hypothetical protein